ncbi:MAG: type II toxin-antitoxin system VapC family toxin [Chloroflexi bacterium]|nr:type II toxin-antitoxin system VapC family toxin [Chloroflexota bacterium]
MILYLDTSALVKRYLIESGSKEVNVLIEQAEIVGSSILLSVEMAAALAKAVRLNLVDAHDAEGSWQDFLSQWPTFTRIALTPTLVDRASRLAWEWGLRGYDAIHFGSALVWQENLETSITLATYDRELWTSAKKAGMNVWPEEF